MPSCIAYSWSVPDIPHLECFRTAGFMHEYPRHSHSTWAIGVVDQGIGGIWYRGANQRGGPGEIIAINPGEVHTGYSLQKGGIGYSMVYIGEELVREILPAHGAMPIFPSVAIRDSVLAPRLRRLCRMMEFGGPSLAIETQLIADLSTLFTRHARASAPQCSWREPAHITRIQEYLRANLQRNVRLSELSALTGLSRAHVIRSFRRVVGMPPYEWLLQARIEEARRLLKEGHAISELAMEFGFADQSHFHRRFKSVTGMTPAAYAKGHYRSRQSQSIPR